MTLLHAVPSPRPPAATADARAVPELQRLARLVPGEPRSVLRRLLALTCEQLGMDIAYVTAITPAGGAAVRLAVRADGSPVAALQSLTHGIGDSWCARVVEQGSILLGDVRGRPELVAISGRVSWDIGAYAAAVLRDGQGASVGTLCCLRQAPHHSLDARDRAVLHGLAEVVAPLVRDLDTRTPVPSPRAAPRLVDVADAVAGARDVEQLSRPLLDALHDLTGLASAYLTVIHEDAGVQEIRHAHNTRAGFELPEGLLVPWADTLCKRALDEGRPCTTDVPAAWGDSQAAADLGIQVYVSVPVALSDGRVWGTLCAADSEPAMRVDEHLPTMRLFAKLIAAQVEQEAAVAIERERTAQARAEADTDPLTRCATRRVAESWLRDNLADLAPHEAVLAVYADVDRFKDINDRWGHAAGDAVLAEVGLRLHSLAQPSDLVARLGGDEFLVAARLPRPMASLVAQRYRDARTLSVPWGDEVLRATFSVGTATSEQHDAAQLLAAADRQMYAAKAGAGGEG